MDFYQRAKRYSIEKFTTRENRITDAWHQFHSFSLPQSPQSPLFKKVRIHCLPSMKTELPMPGTSFTSFRCGNKNAGLFLILHGVTEYINLSDMVSINNGWSRWQWYNENGFSGSF